MRFDLIEKLYNECRRIDPDFQLEIVTNGREDEAKLDLEIVSVRARGGIAISVEPEEQSENAIALLRYTLAAFRVCKRCGDTTRYEGAIYCGAACTAYDERTTMRKLSALRRIDGQV